MTLRYKWFGILGNIEEFADKISKNRAEDKQSVNVLPIFYFPIHLAPSKPPLLERDVEDVKYVEDLFHPPLLDFDEKLPNHLKVFNEVVYSYGTHIDTILRRDISFRKKDYPFILFSEGSSYPKEKDLIVSLDRNIKPDIDFLEEQGLKCSFKNPFYRVRAASLSSAPHTYYYNFNSYDSMVNFFQSLKCGGVSRFNAT